MAIENKVKGSRMRVTTATPGPAAAPSVTETAPAAPVRAPASETPAELQSAVLQPALQALRDMPDIDHEKVAQLRDALAKGELPFNAGKLAGLIERFHRGEQ
jgi:negative regulator of flagellin synthesis FlgM